MNVGLKKKNFHFSECNCNNHANSCHFDQAVYEHSGRISGGVCDKCQHFTQGQYCEECMAFYYRDPNEDIQSPNVCKRKLTKIEIQKYILIKIFQHVIAILVVHLMMVSATLSPTLRTKSKLAPATVRNM